MKVKLELGFIKNSEPKTRIPFWFTTDRVLHFSFKEPALTVETELLNKLQIKEIYTAILKGILTADNDEISVLHEKYFGESQVVAAETSPIVKEDVVEEKPVEEENKYEKVAAKILAKNASKVINQIGKGEVLDGKLAQGIQDLGLLKFMLEKEQKTKNRTTVKEALELRIKSVESVKKESAIQTDFEIEEEDYATIAISEDGISTIDVNEENEESDEE